MERARIDEVHADRMSLSEAYKQARVRSSVSNDVMVWLVIVKGKFVYEGMSRPGFRDMYQTAAVFYL